MCWKFGKISPFCHHPSCVPPQNIFYSFLKSVIGVITCNGIQHRDCPPQCAACLCWGTIGETFWHNPCTALDWPTSLHQIHLLKIQFRVCFVWKETCVDWYTKKEDDFWRMEWNGSLVCWRHLPFSSEFIEPMATVRAQQMSVGDDQSFQLCARFIFGRQDRPITLEQF